MNLEQKVPPVILVFIFSALMFLIGQVTTYLNFEFGFRFEAFIIFVFIGVMFAVAGVASFKKQKTTVNPLNTDNVSALVTSGIYKYSRNPMYVGMLLCLVGFFVYIFNPLNIIFIVLFIWYMNKFQIKPEERFLSTVFGKRYKEYTNNVRRWL